MEVQEKRLVRAALVLGAALAVVALWSPATRALGAEEAPGSLLSGRVFAREVIGGAAMQAEGTSAAELADQTLRRDVSAAPSWFEEEVVPLGDVDDLRAVDDWSVAGFTLDADIDGARQWIAGHLEERGWSLMESGIEGTWTGIKEGGRLTWLLYSCTAVGDATCVVVQAPAS